MVSIWRPRRPFAAAEVPVVGGSAVVESHGVHISSPGRASRTALNRGTLVPVRGQECVSPQDVGLLLSLTALSLESARTHTQEPASESPYSALRSYVIATVH